MDWEAAKAHFVQIAQSGQNGANRGDYMLLTVIYLEWYLTEADITVDVKGLVFILGVEGRQTRLYIHPPVRDMWRLFVGTPFYPKPVPYISATHRTLPMLAHRALHQIRAGSV